MSEGLPKLCFVAGLGGASSYVRQELPRLLAERGVPFEVLDDGNAGSVEQRAEKLREAIQDRVQQDPHFRCHVLAHSLGGFVVREFLMSLRGEPSMLSDVSLSSVIESVTMLAVPVHGTPLGKLAGWIWWDRGLGQTSPRAALGLQKKWEENSAPLAEEAPLKVFSYRSFVGRADQCERWLSRLRMRVSGFFMPSEMGSGRSDSMIPLESQGGGEGLGELKVCHTFFDWASKKVSPSVVNFL